MKTLILLSILSSPFLLLQQQQEIIAKTEHSEFNQGPNPKLNAYKILQAKCNVCHLAKNPRKVFTIYNMDLLAPKIQKQVFVKKRMPKGNEIRLTQSEYDVLEKWLETQNI
ncbi:hypothetical protein JYU20_03735 [Bacteroidales bacterium AH-315-I05]|nr:hypothetical protein [Bacteroidales bacterium AH-315-I05]